jgi:hypothetical protein
LPAQARRAVADHRHLQQLMRTDGRTLATLSDHVVHATVFAENSAVSDWREIEVELGAAGDEPLTNAIRLD